MEINLEESMAVAMNLYDSLLINFWYLKFLRTFKREKYISTLIFDKLMKVCNNCYYYKISKFFLLPL